MPHPLLSSTITNTTTTTMAPSSALKKPTPPKTPHLPRRPTNSLCRHHSPSATLDILIFLLVLFSGAFLIISYFSYLFHSLTLILPTILSLLHLSNPHSQLLFLTLFVVSFLGFAFCFEIFCGHRARRCERKGCKGLKKAMEFDLQLQGEDLMRVGQGSKAVRDVNELPWKGGSEDNPDYECLRAELRKMAPPNGRAVLLFRDKCGCPLSKLEGWGPKRGRRIKKSLTLTAGGDNR